MKYWPMSVVVTSPLMQPAYIPELEQIAQRLPSEGAYYAAMAVANNTAPCDMPNLQAVYGVGCPVRRIFTGYPSFDEWARLERSGVMVGGDDMLFVSIDALH